MKHATASEKLNVLLVGSGNIALHLSRAIMGASNLNLVQIKARKLKSLDGFPNCSKSDDFSKHPACDMIILAISDDAINSVSSNEIFAEDFVVHVSGASPLNTIETKRKGIFYIPYSFSKHMEVNLSDVTACIDAKFDEDFDKLECLAKELGLKSTRVGDRKRAYIHLAAVMSNNFINHLMVQTELLAKDGGFDIDILKPLIQQGLSKALDNGAQESQTGPARRKDAKTIEKHLELLNDDQKEIYNLFTKLIQAQYE